MGNLMIMIMLIMLIMLIILIMKTMMIMIMLMILIMMIMKTMMIIVKMMSTKKPTVNNLTEENQMLQNLQIDKSLSRQIWRNIQMWKTRVIMIDTNNEKTYLHVNKQTETSK